MYHISGVVVHIHNDNVRTVYEHVHVQVHGSYVSVLVLSYDIYNHYNRRYRGYKGLAPACVPKFTFYTFDHDNYK